MLIAITGFHRFNSFSDERSLQAMKLRLERDPIPQMRDFWKKNGETYDLITASMVCQWFEDLEDGLNNLKSMLKPGGTFYFSLPGPDCFKEWRSILDQLGLSSGTPNFSYPDGIYREE